MDQPSDGVTWLANSIRIDISIYKVFLIAFAVIAAVAADVSHLPSNEYLPPVVQESQIVVSPSNEYLPPVDTQPAHELADDGYRYKTHKRVVLRRHRRDVSHLPSNEYLPPVQAAPSNEYLPPVQVAAPAPIQLADDGYRYKTHKRVVIRRHRRDVSHLPSNEYLPPVQETVEVAAPSNEYLAPVEAPVESAVLADDGYRYKTHKRVVLRRHRRDVSHLPSNEYLPPVQETVEVAAPSNEYLAPVEAPVESAVLADDGYRYKTHKRVVLRRHRRDVSHLPSNEYLPPVQETVEVAAPSNEYLAPVEAPVESAVLADDGYRYKTHKRVVLRRHRRDVSHLPSNEYLPPVQETVEVAAPSNEYLAPVEAPVESAVLADDGYRYKTHKRVVLRRHRRDVSHLPSNEYLPPVQETVEVAAPSNEYLAPVEAPVESAVLADDGYRYKTHKRVVLRRHRRDVSHLPSNEYLPPVQETVEVAAPSNEYLAPVEAPVESAVLADDGYRYKTHKRVVLRRHRRDVSHLPSNDYLPPVQEAVEIAAPSNEYLAPVDNGITNESAVLADDGYRYKTQKRRVFRRH
ncbi:uncharacterized protein Dwil_GK28003 [Drosophila willistoni]|uniref:Uncharacterized protein n=1 Tax=Drosophila willistoni TaxID=7260 RepID=A0A0Q9WPL0_DROWI|nr:uncharacterized protein LOC26530005 [Drosophila willistoni]KRF97783.1 uncharacterized protein Dwil_GK28003 [Drosophila willistoni]